MSPPRIVDTALSSYGLTDRETEVAHHLCRGLTVQQIATGLCISVHTVRDHTKAIHRKMDVGSRGELVARLLFDHVLPLVEHR